MKEKIHPKYEIITVKCACGNVFQTRSTRGSFTVDICAACHPFYTGQQKMIDAAGKIEKFRRKYAKFQQKQDAKQKQEAMKKENAPQPEPVEEKKD